MREAQPMEEGGCTSGSNASDCHVFAGFSLAARPLPIKDRYSSLQLVNLPMVHFYQTALFERGQAISGCIKSAV